mgnify:CR=1 FL=1
MMTEILRARRARMGQDGFSTMGVATALVGTVSLGALLTMNSTDLVGAAANTACQYDKQIVMTAVESYYLTGDQALTYPTPAGPDGLQAVRDEGFLRTESKFWKYTGDGPDHKTPQYEQLDPTLDCN